MKPNRYITAFLRLYNDLNEVAKTYKKTKIYFMIDACFCFLLHGATPNEYLHFNLYKFKNYERKQFLTYKRTNKLEKKYNSIQNYHIFWDKEKFNKAFSEFIKREWIYTGDASIKEIENFINKHEKIIVKPTGLSSGRGIYILDKNNYNAKQLKEEKLLLEKFVVQCEEMKQLNPVTVNTIRIYTVLDKNKKVHIISAAIRVGGKNSIVDNYHNGGCAFPVNEETGIVCKAGIDFKGKEYLFSPATNFKMIGFQIPHWEELVKFVNKAAKKYVNSKLIAWDIAITDNGFEMIEGNYKWSTDLMQSLDKRGRYKIICKLLK